MDWDMNYCNRCGGQLEKKIPAGDNRSRFVCMNCGLIHYSNPRVVVGTIPIFAGKVLLCKRAIDPAYGLWTLPSGFMENEESVEEGALRETMEEAGARVEIDRLHTVYSCSGINHVYMLFLAHIVDLNFAPGPESLEVKLFEPGEIPWDEIAFTAVHFALERFTGVGDSIEVNMGCKESPLLD